MKDVSHLLAHTYYGSYCMLADAREAVKHSIALLLVLVGFILVILGIVLYFLLS